MSHFSVAVFSEDGGKSVEELLAPYHEFECTGIDDEYVKDVDVTEKIREYYDEEETEQIFIDFCKGWYRYNDIVFEGENPDISGKHKYGYIIADKSGEVVKVVERTNPNKKWDWWTVGGRFRGIGMIGENGSKMKDIKFELDKSVYEKSKREWELIVEDQEPITQEEERIKKFHFFNKKYYVERYHNKETYAKNNATFGTFAVVLPDGSWHEKGEMGWWGVSSETADESFDWDTHFKEMFLDTANPEWTLTVVDCHI